MISRTVKIASAVIAIILVIFAVTALVQLHEQRQRVEETIGLTKEARADISRLFDKDGLAKFPELGIRNTPESRIDATFLAVQMAMPRARTVVNNQTTDALYAYSVSATNPVGIRLKAFATLKLLNDSRWKEGASLVESIESTLPKTISLDTLANYLALAEPINLLDDSFSKSKLVRFDATQNEETERLAASALALNYLFDNKEQLSKYFPELKAKLCTWAGGGGQHVQQTLISAAALVGTMDAQCNLEEKEFTKSYVGCENSSLVSLEKSKKSKCSLLLTYYAWRAALWR